MHFIVILIGLALDRWTSIWNYVREFKFFHYYLYWMKKIVHKKQFQGYVGLVILLVPLLIIVQLLNIVFFHILFGLAGLVYSVIIFGYCLRPFKFETFYDANRNIFALIFWFLVLGPMGACLYRFNDFLTEQQEDCSKIAVDFHRILDWIPIRLMVLGFALVSHFLIVIRILKDYVFLAPVENSKLVNACGYASLEMTEQDDHSDLFIQKLSQLVERTLIVWLVTMAVVILV